MQSPNHLAQLLGQTAAGLEDNQTDLWPFLKGHWDVVEPDVPLIESYHTQAIAEHVQAALEGEITRLVINAPPRIGKSLPGSVFAPPWAWTRWASKKFITVSYSQPLASKHNVDRRLLIRSPRYQEKWGHVFTLAEDQNLKSEFVNSERGHMVARGTGAGVTGYGADVIMLDDPLNPELAESDAERRAVRDYFDRTLYSRLDDKKRGSIILIEQRLHAKDLSAHLLGQGGWFHLNLPAEAPRRTVISFPKSGREVVREEGDALCPEREDKETLAKTKVAVGTRRYAAQYQQAPSEEEGNIFKRALWGYWRTQPSDLDELIQSWDMTFKGTDGTDFVVGQVWGRKGAREYLLDQVRGRMSFTATLDAFRALTRRWPQAHRKLVEDKANGSAVENVLKREIGGIILVNPKGGKLARAYAAQPYQEAGNLVIPDPEVFPWVEEFINELGQFPDGDNDDQVDAATQAINFWNTVGEWRPVR